MSMTSRISGTSRLDLAAVRMGDSRLLISGLGAIGKAGELAVALVVYPVCACISSVSLGFPKVLSSKTGVISPGQSSGLLPVGVLAFAGYQPLGRYGRWCRRCTETGLCHGL